MAAWLARILQLVLGGLLARVVIGGGMTILSYAGISVVMEAALGEVVGMIGQLPSAVLNMALLFGLGDALNYIGSAFLTVIAWKSLGLGVAFSNQVQQNP